MSCVKRNLIGAVWNPTCGVYLHRGRSSPIVMWAGCIVAGKQGTLAALRGGRVAWSMAILAKQLPNGLNPVELHHSLYWDQKRELKIRGSVFALFEDRANSRYLSPMADFWLPLQSSKHQLFHIKKIIVGWDTPVVLNRGHMVPYGAMSYSEATWKKWHIKGSQSVSKGGIQA